MYNRGDSDSPITHLMPI